MTQHQGLPVAGYKPTQSQSAVDKVNSNKVLEEMVLRQLDELAKDGQVDPRWLAIGRTEIEKGWMAVNRAIFRNGRVTLPGEDA